MRKFIIVATIAASLAGGAAAFANEPATTTPAATDGKPKVDPKDDPNRIVCTREHEVGSNRPKKVCMTVAEREKRRDAAARALDTSNRRGTQNPGATP